MELGTSLSSKVSTASLLSWIADDAEARAHLEIREWQHIVAWAEANTVDQPDEAATVRDGFLDTGIPIAGPGAPMVSEFALMELIAVLGRTPDGGRLYVGKILECAWRLPELYAAVLDGRLAPWRALRIAELTHPLTQRAAAWVDHQLAIAVESVTWAQIDRLVEEAITRFDPERAEAERKKRADQRRFTITGADSGLVYVDALMDAADGHDLDQTITRRAHLLGQLGDTDSLDVRRSKAAGELARQDLSLDLIVSDPDTGEVIAKSPGRRSVLNLHITDTTLTGDNPVGRCEETRGPVLASQIREWLSLPGSTIIVRPVIDLADCVPVDSYEIPDRHRIRVQLRDHTCRFPSCTTPAQRCDLDHAIEHNKGGPTCPCNLVPLCRRHHRAKTHGTWTYRVLRPSHYLWTSPNGARFLVTPAGTDVIDPIDSPEPERP
ncbi:HNH endonuclease signature motif containing protein [Nocardioides sp. J54]|uniref:HNH endonuclease signature motif containing protein n=1 Tax=Nocardioides sp. J54 TaxID=935866 RepID=UPI00048CF9EC|nr:HNH endonuclease signature motif containing protein [Nocardioides sp. J54]